MVSMRTQEGRLMLPLGCTFPLFDNGKVPIRQPTM